MLRISPETNSYYSHEFVDWYYTFKKAVRQNVIRRLTFFNIERTNASADCPDAGTKYLEAQIVTAQRRDASLRVRHHPHDQSGLVADGRDRAAVRAARILVHTLGRAVGRDDPPR